MQRKWRRIAICVAIATASAFATFFVDKVGFFHGVDLKALDAHFVFRGARAVENIVLLTIDKKSLETFPEVQLFWHPYYAEAIKASAAAGAKVMVLDVAFGVPVNKWEPNHDQMLAEAVQSVSSVMPVICAYVPEMTAKQQDWPIPINMLAPALGLSAFANLTTDPDDFVREQELLAPSSSPDAPFARSMALRAAEKYVGEDVVYRDGRLSLKGRAIPISPQRTIAINYAGPAGTVPAISLADFVQASRAGKADRLKQWVSGKIVLLGPDSIDDRHATPFFTLFSSDKWRTPGVEIHANSINTILTGNYLVPVPDAVRMWALLLIAGITVYAAAVMRVGRAAICLTLVAALIFVTTHLLFRAGVVLSTSTLLEAWIIAAFSAIVYRFATAEKKSAFFRSAVALFVGRQVARSLDESQHLGLTGKRQMVTILFTDIRGFTAFCEEKDPAVVVELLNAYMGAMVSIIHRYHGHVNKFIGDGILAVFSDDDLRGEPGTHAGDHALRASRCAIEMVTAPGEFKTGAGLHSGPVVIGNVGSAEKMEFTVLGDTVNLASRLESMNKERHTRMLLSESTYELLDGTIEMQYLGSVPVRGKTLPMKIYTAAALIGQEKEIAALVSSEER